MPLQSVLPVLAARNLGLGLDMTRRRAGSPIPRRSGARTDTARAAGPSCLVPHSNSRLGSSKISSSLKGVSTRPRRERHRLEKRAAGLIANRDDRRGSERMQRPEPSPPTVLTGDSVQIRVRRAPCSSGVNASKPSATSCIASTIWMISATSSGGNGAPDRVRPAMVRVLAGPVA